MCNCASENPSFVLKRNTVWNNVSVQFPYAISGYLVQIDFKNYTTGAIVKSIKSTDSSAGSYILVDTTLNKIYPVLTAADSSLFLEDTLYIFDIAFILSGQVVRRTGVLQLTAINGVTTPA